MIERYALGIQMRRAAISITANIAEGFGRQSWKENTRFCRISRGSAYELRDHLTTAFDQKYLSDEDFERLDHEIIIFIKQLNAYIGGMVRRSQKQQNSLNKKTYISRHQ
jgi:four helix bundle protein